MFPFPAPGSEQEVQVVQRVRRNPESGRLVDFCVSIQVRDLGADEGWCDIERVDCKHGFVHVDRQSPGGETTKDVNSVPAGVGDNLDKAYVWACDYVWEVEERLRGWA